MPERKEMDRKGKSTSSVGAEEVVGHVGVEVEVVRVVQEIPGQRPSGFPKI